MSPAPADRADGPPHVPGRAHVDVEDARSPADSPDVHVDVARWRDLALAALVTEGAVGSLGLTFVDAVEIAELNEAHMGVVGPTDVLSFPLDAVEPYHPDDVASDHDTGAPGESDAGKTGEFAETDGADEVPRLLGDVVVSPAVAAAQYAGHAGTLDDELALLVVHGVLHVLGHDHGDPAETALMRTRERILLEQHHWGHSAPPGFRHDHVEP